MALKIRCERCEVELEEPGALLFSPPDSSGSCTKKHYCVKCYVAIHNFCLPPR
jgi:hypothetical protein